MKNKKIGRDVGTKIDEAEQMLGIYLPWWTHRRINNLEMRRKIW